MTKARRSPRTCTREGTIDQFREFVIHRSAYQLKEADPHTWAIPRMRGAPKAAMVEIQADEYGSGRPDRVHSTLFAKAMDALDLDSSYGAYLDRIPGVTLATVNLISRFGLHRELRGALTGHLAMFEITSPIPNRRYAGALRRFGASDDAIDFFDEHVEADSVHEQVAARDLAQGLAQSEPEPDGADRLRRRVAAPARVALGCVAALVLGGRPLFPARAGELRAQPRVSSGGVTSMLRGAGRSVAPPSARKPVSL